MKMHFDIDPCRLDHRGVRFLRALRGGDAAALAELWHEAETDPELGSLFEGLLAEEGEDVTPLPLPAVIVRHRSLNRDKSPSRARTHFIEEPQSHAGFEPQAG